MSDKSISIIPRITKVKHKESKIEDVLKWLFENDIINPNKSDCTLSNELGYPISKGAIHVVKEPEYLPFKLSTNGLEIIKERKVFDTGSNGLDSLICPNCKSDIMHEDWGFFNEWALAKSDNLTCPKCNIGSNIHTYSYQPQWGFSNLGFTFWNWPTLKTEFIEAFTKILQCKVDVVYMHI